MRLIDGDKLLEVIAKQERWNVPDFIYESIKNAQTIDAKPVLHGKWINDKGLYKCSVCNNFTITGWANCISIEQMNKTMKYCNNCGAKMKGVEE